MAIDFPNSPGNGSQHTASGITWTYDGTTWKADGLTSSYSLPTASSTVLGGVKVGSGLSISTGTISSTLQSVVDSNATCTSEVFVQNKLYFSNNFANLTALNAVNTTTYHGMFAHVHAEGHGYFAHAGAWTQLIDTGSSIGELGDVDLSSTPTDGQVLKWDNASSKWKAASDATGGSSYTNTDVDTHLNISAAASGQILSWNGSDYAWVADQTGGGGGSYTNTDVDLHLNQANPTSGHVLSWNGSDYAWVAQSGGGGGALQSRQSFSQTTTGSIANGASQEITITAYKTFALLKIQTSHAAWVTLYTNSTTRTADTSRNETTDPLPGSGVIAEVITTGAQTQIITPGTFGWNDDTTPAAQIYAKVVNKSGSTAAITVTITVVQLEG